MLPDAHGVIVTIDKAVIMFTLQGRTVFEQDHGKQLLGVSFEAEAETYRWLNETFCVLEGLIDSERLRMRARIHSCKRDLVQVAAVNVVRLHWTRQPDSNPNVGGTRS